MSALLLMCLIALFASALTAGQLLPMRAFVTWALCMVFKYRDIIKEGKGLYLRRFYLTPRNRPTWWPNGWKWYRFFLHNILRSDDDRDQHNHPWSFTSIILAGCYLEHIFFPRATATRYLKRWAYPGTVLKNSAAHTHRVEIIRPVWSLVMCPEATQEWGFWIDGHTVIPDEFIVWHEYLNEPRGPLPLEDRIRGSAR